MDKCLLIPLWFGAGILIVYFLFWFDWTPVLAWIRKKRDKKVYTNIYGATGPNPWPANMMSGPTGPTQKPPPTGYTSNSWYEGDKLRTVEDVWRENAKKKS